MDEIKAVQARYERRSHTVDQARYSLLNHDVLRAHQERQRAIVHWIRRHNIQPVGEKRVLEIGCGEGQNLLDLVRLGFKPENLTGNELLATRREFARRQLSPLVSILPGDASSLDLPSETFDIVLQSTVFSSLLDDSFQELLAAQMWRWIKPGGGVLWYDFIYNNPKNPDVRGVPLKRVRDLFRQTDVVAWKLTLAPPIARRAVAFTPNLYDVLNVPWLRTHLLCWIPKLARGGGFS
jgi:SAM-dependent methyltransferase